MRQIILIAHISLDGYVADCEGGLSGFEPGEDSLDFVGDICGEADTILSGRITHEMLHSFWPGAGCQQGATPAEKKYSSWYNAAKKMVITKSPSYVSGEDVFFVNDDPRLFAQKIRCPAGKPIVIFGSPNMAGQLMAENMIDVYWIFVYPVVFGSGISLFNSNIGQRQLKLTETRRFANGETALKYVAK